MQEEDNAILARELREALAAIVRAFHAIAAQLEAPGAQRQIMIMAIDLIAVISRIEERLPASGVERRSAQSYLLARDMLASLGVIGKALVAISENTKDPDARRGIRDSAIELVPIVGRTRRA